MLLTETSKTSTLYVVLSFGVKFQRKDPNLNDKPIRMIIFAKHARIDLDCEEIGEQLLTQRITEAKRLISRIKDKGNTDMIRTTITNKEKDTLMCNRDAYWQQSKNWVLIF